MSYADREIGEIVTTIGTAPASGFIRMKAGEALTGGINEGAVVETLTGAWPNITAKAKIIGGALDGVEVDLTDTLSPSSIAHYVKVS